MLDAYIIEKIRRERESRERMRAPLRIEVPRAPLDRDPSSGQEAEEPESERDRGVAIIDFSI